MKLISARPSLGGRLKSIGPSGWRSAGGARRRRACLLRLCVALGTLCLLPAAALAQVVDPGFNSWPWPSEPVKAVAAQPDGKVLIGGAFEAGAGRVGLARLNPDGSLDVGFNASADGSVFSLTLSADGKVLVGGGFQHVNGQFRPGLARLNPDGSLDEGFNPVVEGTVFPVVIQPDGKILIAGFFSRVGGQQRVGVARLNPDGSLDPSFDPGPGPDSYVFSMALRRDGKIVIGGMFQWVGEWNSRHMALLNPDGTLDRGFNPVPDGIVYALQVREDDSVLAGGDFKWVWGLPRKGLAHIDAHGTVVESFYVGGTTTFSVRGIATQPDGRILVGGDFPQVWGRPQKNLARLNPDGTLDASFNDHAPDGPVRAIALQSNGGTIVGGDFMQIGGRTRRHVARLLPPVPTGRRSGEFDPSARFPYQQYTTIQVVALQPDGRMLISGGPADRKVVRLHPDGAVDPSFNVYADMAINTIVIQPDGKILIGGGFRYVNGEPRAAVARLNPDGSLDPTFNANVSHWVITVAVQSDGKILIGGNIGSVDGWACRGLARLDPDGSRDRSFDPHRVPGSPHVIALQPDGNILVGGSFLSSTETDKRIFRLRPDGSLDDSFRANTGSSSSGYIYSIVVQPDGKILAGGWLEGPAGSYFLRLNPDGTTDLKVPFPTSIYDNVFSIALQADGRFLLGGSYRNIGGQPRSNISRLHPDGLVDLSFDARVPPRGGSVDSVSLQADGRVLAFGMVELFDTDYSPGGGRLFNDPATDVLTVDDAGTGITWLRGGAAPEVERVIFEVSVGGQDYAPLGDGRRVAGGWRLDGVALPPGQSLSVRARGFYRTGFAGSGGSVVEKVRGFTLTGN